MERGSFLVWEEIVMSATPAFAVYLNIRAEARD